MDCSLPGFSVHGILQATVLEWVAISFSRGSSRPRDPTRVSHTVDRHFTIYDTTNPSMKQKQTHIDNRSVFTKGEETGERMKWEVGVSRHHLLCTEQRLSRWHTGKESACRCRRCGFDPWVGKIPWKKEMATHSSILAWKILWTDYSLSSMKEPGRLQSMG